MAERMIIVNKYGEELAELKKKGDFWMVPEEKREEVCCWLAEGDILKVEKVETDRRDEDDEEQAAYDRMECISRRDDWDQDEDLSW